ncbi:MAG: hypothetical protein HN348_26290 [Proteobacteria bacterium]|nr:hypothetical protein [Pseudomonadota bacterium]
MIAAIRAALKIQPIHRPADCNALLELWRGNRDFVTAESTLILEEAPKLQQEPPRRSLLPWILVAALATTLALLALSTLRPGQHQTVPPETVLDKQLDRAQMALQDAEFLRAIQHAEVAIERRPGEPSATLALGEAHYFLGEQMRTHTIYTGWLDSGGDDAASSMLRIKQRALKGEDVKESVAQHFVHFPQDYIGRVAASWLRDDRTQRPFQGQEHYFDVEHLDAALKLEPHVPLAFVAYTFLHTDDKERSKWVRGGLEVAPRNAELMSMGFHLALAMGEVDQAQALAADLMTHHPNNPLSFLVPVGIAIHTNDVAVRDAAREVARNQPLDNFRLWAQFAIVQSCGVGMVHWSQEVTEELLERTNAASEPHLAQEALRLDTQCALFHETPERALFNVPRHQRLALAPELDAASQKDVQLNTLYDEALALALAGRNEEARAALTRLNRLGLKGRNIANRLAVADGTLDEPLEPVVNTCAGTWAAGYNNALAGHSKEAIAQLKMLVTSSSDLCPHDELGGTVRLGAHYYLSRLYRKIGDDASADRHVAIVAQKWAAADRDLPHVQ